MNRVRCLVLNAALGPLDYKVPEGLRVEPGSVVECPLGPRTVIGIVWEAERLPGTEVPAEKLRPLRGILPVPPLSAPLRRLIEWTADYYVASLAGVARMALSSGGALKGPATMTEYRLTGGLPERMNMKLVEPLRELFKDEVRELGRELGLPEIFVGRHPFPGPGLAIRIPGEVTKERCDILRKADAIYLEEIRNAGLYDAIWQAFAVLLPVKTVGVMGDGRTYDSVCGLRAVTSTDGMTADIYPFDASFLSRVATRIINEVQGINRVVYDYTSKPPGTIEWE